MTATNGTFTINKKTATVTADAKSKIYGDSDPTLTATVEGTVGSDTLDYTLSREAGENVGEYAITVTLGENPNYTVSVETGVFTINKKAVTVTADNKSKTYGDSDPALTATIEGLVGKDTLSYSLVRAEGENVGTYTITPAGEAVQGNYNVVYLTGTLEITRAAATVTAVNGSKIWGNSDPALTATVTGLRNGDAESVISYTLSREAGENVGSYAITPAGDDVQGNYNVTYVPATFIIESATAKIGNVYFETLDEALAAAVNGDTVVLLRDATLSSAFVTDSGYVITVDLNGHKTSGAYIDLYNGFLTVTDSGETKGNFGNLVYVNVGSDESKPAGGYNSFTLSAGAVMNNNIYVYQNSTPKGYGSKVNVNGTLNGLIFVLGNIREGNSVINVSGTINSSDDVAIALNGYAAVNVLEGAHIEAKDANGNGTGIEVRAGNLNVTGGTIIGHGEVAVNANGSGTTTTGAGIAIAQHTTALDIGVNIEGGEIIGPVALNIANPEGNTAGEIDVSVSGGYFTGSPTVSVSDNETRTGDFVSGGYFSDAKVDGVPSDQALVLRDGWYVLVDAVATVTHDGVTTGYETLSAAIEAAQTGDAVILIKDAAETRVMISKSLTLDLGGHTFTGRVTVDNGEVTVENGTITGRLDAYDDAIVNLAEDATVNGQVIVWGDGTFGQAGCKTPTLNVHGTITNTGNSAISTNGTDMSGAIINVYDGASITSTDDIAVYLPSGNLNVSGGTITGTTAIYAKSGSVTISGGKITGSGAAAEYSFNGNGGNSTGDALVIESCGYPNGTPSVSVTGGTFVSANGKAIASYAAENNETVKGFVEGGEFNTVLNTDVVKKDSQCTTTQKNENGLYYIVEEITVSFDANGGSAVETVKLPKGEKVKEPATARTGYTFDVWQLNGESYDFTAAVSEDIELKAKWTPIPYTITWLDDDGTVIDTTDVNYDDTPAHADAFRADDENYHYIFTGWTPAISTVTGEATYTATYQYVARTYGDPVWTWNGHDSATARFTTNDGFDEFTLTVDAVITHETTLEEKCEETGTETYTASVTFRGNDYSDQTTEVRPALGHDYVYTYAWNSANSKVTARRVCRHDGAHTDYEAVSTTSEITKDASCYQEGEITYTAVFTKDFFETQTKKAATPKTHSGEPTFVWLDNETVLVEIRCTECGELLDTVSADVTDSVTKEPTCTEKGERTYTATAQYDGKTLTDKKTEDIDKLPHVHSAAVQENRVEATCTEKGSYESVVYCSVCHAELSRETVEIAALGHDLVHHDAKAATCTEIGWEAYDTCSRCDYTTYVEIAALGHVWGEPVWTWNGTSASAVFTCERDGSHTEQAEAEITETTAAGIKTYTATVTFNGNTYTDTKEAALSYTVTFVDENGAPLADPQTVNHGETAAAPENPVKEGFFFKQWNRNGTKFNFSTPIEEDTELVASWTAAVAKIDGEYYKSLSAAITALKGTSGKTLEWLGGNQTLSGVLNRFTLADDQDFTLDLGGSTLTMNGAYFTLNGGKLMVTNGTINAKGNNSQLFTVNSGELTITETATLNGLGGVSPIAVFGPATVNTSGTLTAENSFAIAGNGAAGKGGYTVNVTGGTVSSANAPAIYHPNEGTVNISGGVITGATAVYQKSGTLNISGGKLTGNGASADYTYNGNGAIATGDAIVIDTCGYPGGAPETSITGGTFISENAQPIGSYAYGEAEPADGFVSGGGFSAVIPADLCADGYHPVTEAVNGLYGIETHTLTAYAAVDATCTEAGNRAYWSCDACHKFFSDENGENEIAENSWVIPAKGHTLTAHEAIEATCTEAGNSAYWSCSVCGKFFGDANGKNEIAEDSWIIPAKGHSFGDWSVTKEPTCTEAGEKTRVCSECGETETETIAASGHSYVVSVIDPTCTQIGYTAHTCSVCGDYYGTDFKAALGHDYNAVVTVPTCTEHGYTTHTCSRCDDSYVDSYTDALGHNMTAHEAIGATCTKNGVSAYWSCETCHKFFSDEDGENEIAENSWVIPAKCHALAAHEAVEATCTEDGNSAYWSCETCHKFFSDSNGENEIAENSWVIAAEGHHYNVVWTWAADHSSATATFTCGTCQDKVILTDNNPGRNMFIAATENNPGLVKWTAEVELDGRSYSPDPVYEEIPFVKLDYPNFTIMGVVNGFRPEDKEQIVTITDTLEGQFTVTYGKACVVAVKDSEGNYIRLHCTAVNGEENTYAYDLSELGYDFDSDIEIIVAVKGDVNGDGLLNVLDRTFLSRGLLLETNPSYLEFDDSMIFMSDMDGNGNFNILDRTRLGRALLQPSSNGYLPFDWDIAS
ncbi:MAG: InlB B-repeat-containing protein [Clostridia bacterium]|nr:InlB B-repeat-containing protein [Clostridia bacterium]